MADTSKLDIPRPKCDPGKLHEGCDGPPPTPWLSWEHCFMVYEFREILVRIGQSVAGREGIRVRVRFEHALCPMGRKQGPIVHSLTLLPKEEVRIYEYDRYRRSTSVDARFSQRSTFFHYINTVNDTLASVKTDFGSGFSFSATASSSSSGGFNLGLVAAGNHSSSSTALAIQNHLNVDTVFESFRHVAEVSSQAVETERSIVVSTFDEHDTGTTTFRTLRNENHCRAVTYFIRRVFEVYCLSTRIVGIEVEIDGNWVDINAVPQAARDAILKQIGVLIGSVSKRSAEIALPTDGLLYEAELANCSSCEPEEEKRQALETRRLELEIELMERENERRKARVAAGELSEFEPCCPEAPEGDT